MQRMKNWILARMPIFWGNWISATGSIVAVTVVILMLMMLVFYVANALTGVHTNPYVDLIAFMMLPAFLGAGVVLLLVGNLVRRRRERRGIATPTAAELGGAVLMRKFVIVAVVGLLFLVGFGTFSYEAYHFTDSNRFCAEICHTVMTPEATAHSRSPHANVPCVSCHIGPGASWFVRAKLSGLRQVWAVATDSYSRPIPTPVENLRPARETCEVCHWPAKFHGSRLAVRRHYEDDRANTPTVTANLIHVGGPEGESGGASGIHWHVDPGNSIRYRHLDDEREKIVEVVLTTPEGEVRYLRGGAGQDPAQGRWRTMDCVDCHNRPTHIYEVPRLAVDEALVGGRLDPGVPWLKREAVRVLKEVRPDGDTAAAIAARLQEIYAAEHPDDLAALTARLEPTAQELAAILDRNVYPAMNITWGTYRSNLSHFDLDGELDEGGCFRCHDDELEAEGGRSITQDCDLCHDLLAEQEKDWKGLPGVDPAALFAR